MKTILKVLICVAIVGLIMSILLKVKIKNIDIIGNSKVSDSEIAFQNKENFSELIRYLKEKQIICEEYVQYLLKLNNSLNK